MTSKAGFGLLNKIFIPNANLSITRQNYFVSDSLVNLVGYTSVLDVIRPEFKWKWLCNSL